MLLGLQREIISLRRPSAALTAQLEAQQPAVQMRKPKQMIIMISLLKISLCLAYMRITAWKEA